MYLDQAKRPEATSGNRRISMYLNPETLLAGGWTIIKTDGSNILWAMGDARVLQEEGKSFGTVYSASSEESSKEP